MKTLTLLLIFAGITGIIKPSNAQDTLFLTLDKALEIAYLQSPDVIRSRINLEQSELRLVRQKASLKPQLGLNLSPFSYNRNYNFDELNSKYYLSEDMSSSGDISISQKVKWTGGTISLSEGINWRDNKNETYGSSGTSFNHNFRINYKQPLFTYNEIKMEIRETELSVENAKLTYAIAQLNIEQSVTDEFYSLYDSYQSLQDAQYSHKLQLQTYEITKNKVEAKLNKESELMQTEIDLGNAINSLAQAEDNYENAKDNFKVRLGLPLDLELKIIANIEISPVIIDPELAVQYALQQRMELRQTEIGIENQYMSLTQTKAQDKFRGDLNLTAGWGGNDSSFGGIFKNQQSQQTISLGLTIPIWDWGVRKANIKSQELSIELQEYNFELEKTNLALDIKSRCKNINRLYKSVELSRRNVENAERTFLIDTENYKNNNMTAYDYQQRQQQLMNEKKNYTSSIINYKKQVLQLKLITLWDFESNVSILPVNLLK